MNDRLFEQYAALRSVGRARPALEWKEQIVYTDNQALFQLAIADQEVTIQSQPTGEHKKKAERYYYQPVIGGEENPARSFYISQQLTINDGIPWSEFAGTRSQRALSLQTRPWASTLSDYPKVRINFYFEADENVSWEEALRTNPHIQFFIDDYFIPEGHTTNNIPANSIAYERKMTGKFRSNGKLTSLQFGKEGIGEKTIQDIVKNGSGNVGRIVYNPRQIKPGIDCKLVEVEGVQFLHLTSGFLDIPHQEVAVVPLELNTGDLVRQLFSPELVQDFRQQNTANDASWKNTNLESSLLIARRLL